MYLKYLVIFDFLSDSVDDNARMVIVNALFFQGAWALKFDEKKRKQFFTKSNGKKILIPMMTRESKKQTYAEFNTDLLKGVTSKCIALAIPYEVPENT